MKKIIILNFLLCLALASKAQSDIKTSLVSFSANNIEVGQSSILRYNVGNFGTANSSYAIGQVTVSLSIPSSIFAFSSVIVPAGPFFNWTYNSTENALIGVNHTPINQNQSENVDVNLIATTTGTATGNINVDLDPSATNLSADNDPSLFNLTVIAKTLPVRLIGFTGKRTSIGNDLMWTVAGEQNFSHYEVEKSKNAKEFLAIVKVEAKGLKNYSYTEALSNVNISDAYYRLKMVDLDGKYEYSKIIFINSESGSSMVGSAYPNPVVAQEMASVMIKSYKKMPWTISVFDFSGKQINKTVILLEKGANKVNINTKGTSASIVLVMYESEDGIFSEKVSIK